MVTILDAMFPENDRLEIVRGNTGLILTTVNDGECRAVLLSPEGAEKLAREIITFLKATRGEKVKA